MTTPDANGGIDTNGMTPDQKRKANRERVAAGKNQAMPRGDATSLPAIQRVGREVSRIIAAVNSSRRGKGSRKK